MNDERPGFRILPRVGKDNEHFWRGGAHGELRILHCDACETWVHPPQPVCPECLATTLTPCAVSGRATLATYTVNRNRWIPGFDPPYAIGIVELPEQSGLRLTTQIVGVEFDDIRIGMPLRVRFEVWEDGDERVHIPLFEPAPSRPGSDDEYARKKWR